MKQTMKKCLALLFTMAVPAAAAPATTYNKEITFTNVAGRYREGVQADGLQSRLQCL